MLNISSLKHRLFGKWSTHFPKKIKPSDEALVTMIEVLQPFIGKIRSITLDNGKEYAADKEVRTALGSKIYFAHPYSCWAQGLIENANGLIRQYLRRAKA